MSFLTASSFLKALGWALVNSVWQFAICWLLYYILVATTKKMAASVKHSIALALLFLGSVFFITELAAKLYNAPAASALPGYNLVTSNQALYNSYHSAGNYIDVLMPYWSLLYLACIVLLFAKLCFFVRRAENLRREGISKMEASWRIYLQNIARQLGIQKEVKAFLSIHIDTPQVIGFLKPAILLPAACLTNLTPAQLEAVLLHELVHIKRNDYLVNLFVASIEILFFFNPFVKQLTASIRKEREYSCDDMVIQFKYQPQQYASALLILEKSRLVPVTYGIAASGKNQKQLLTRIERIVGINNRQPGFYRASAGLAALLLLAFFATIHPTKMNADLLVPGSIILADNNIINLQPAEKSSAVLTHQNTKPVVVIKPAPIAQHKKDSGISGTDDQDATNADQLTLTTSANDAAEVAVQDAAAKENRDFSLAQNEKDEYSIAPPASPEEPYVPANSFSFQITQDSAMPKVKGETFNERKAREALIKAQMAISSINWQKIEKSLKLNVRDLAKLKRAITIQLKTINFQKIDGEVQEQLSQEQFMQLQLSAQQNQSIKQYQQSEAAYEAFQKQITAQDQVIKINDLRMRQNQQSAEQQQKKLLEEMKKRRIIYL